MSNTTSNTTSTALPDDPLAVVASREEDGLLIETHANGSVSQKDARGLRPSPDDRGHGYLKLDVQLPDPDHTVQGEPIIDHTLPGQSWAFDADVARVFDNMLARSIPQYEVMRDACLSVARTYRQPQTDIVDIGAARGEAIAPLVAEYHPRNRFLLSEISQPMLAVLRSRFAGLERVHVEAHDLRGPYLHTQASVTLSVFTLQFVPMEHRLRLLRDIYRSTVYGGCIILAEKVLGASADLDALMVDRYYRMKRQNGYSEEEIQRKRLSLEGVLVPVTAGWNTELLRGAGFTEVDCFWRWMNFGAWVGVKR